MALKTLEEILDVLDVATDKKKHGPWHAFSSYGPEISESKIYTKFASTIWRITFTPFLKVLEAYDEYSIIINRYSENCIIIQVEQKTIDDSAASLLINSGTGFTGRSYAVDIDNAHIIKQILHGVEERYKIEVPFDLWDVFEEWHRTRAEFVKKLNSISLTDPAVGS